MLPVAPSRAWPTRRVVFLLFLYCTALGLLLFGYKYLDYVASNHSRSPWIPFLEEMTGAYSLFVLLPAIMMLARRFPIRRNNWPRVLPLHVALVVGFTTAHTTLMAVSRHIIFPLAGLGHYDYGRMPVRYVMEGCNDLVGYCLILSLIYLFDHYRASRDRELATAQLESRLAQAQLQNLRLQLQPHFMFNALNTVSALMYEDPRAADEMISRLSDLLRLTLRSSQAQEVPLEDEMQILDLYLKVMRARFEERLAVTIDIERGAESALVPQLILQPLVENSIRHGIDPATATVRVDISARRDNGTLRLAVRDHGGGIRGDRDSMLGKGIGLSNTAGRLACLYGAGQRLGLENAADGGLLVTVDIPFHTAPGNS